MTPPSPTPARPGTCIVYPYNMSQDPFDTGPRRPPTGVIVLWVVAALLILAALAIIIRGEQVRSELGGPRPAPVSDQVG